MDREQSVEIVFESDFATADFSSEGRGDGRKGIKLALDFVIFGSRRTKPSSTMSVGVSCAKKEDDIQRRKIIRPLYTFEGGGHCIIDTFLRLCVDLEGHCYYEALSIRSLVLVLDHPHRARTHPLR